MMMKQSSVPLSGSTSMTIFVVLALSAIVFVAQAADVSWRSKREGCGAELRLQDQVVEGDDIQQLVSDQKTVEDVDQPQAMCCDGKNNSCLAWGARLNAPTATTCFCDANCMTFGDCCLDYTKYCPAVDCAVEEEWGEWSECDVKCGQGLKRRQKVILVEAKNGGRRCLSNETSQTAVCVGTTCKVQRASERSLELQETGRIIPATFATWRQDKLYSPFQDIRKNLFDHYGDPSAVNRPAYCAQFEVTDVHRTCRKMSKHANRWLAKMVKGAKVCVECQSFAMQKELGGRCRGHGVLHRQTQWKPLTVSGCHGKWRLVAAHSEKCDCNPADGLSFSFV